MKKTTILALKIFTILLIGCSGSDTYRGAWKATDSQKAKFEIFFNEKSFTVKDSTGEIKEFNYSQNSVQIANSIETYGINLEDGRGYQINFPIAHDESLGLIKDENGLPIYTISRNTYTNYEDVFKLQ